MRVTLIRSGRFNSKNTYVFLVPKYFVANVFVNLKKGQKELSCKFDELIWDVDRQGATSIKWQFWVVRTMKEGMGLGPDHNFGKITTTFCFCIYSIQKPSQRLKTQ